ncbi:hypothetical protein L1987_56389 [Smallanthus sonchifolius]|uniref:Uncharacterized protein n=1 Tax=Smallanthus sonchifolius TaxID=185202 RepID=A0ACB9EDB1_9ASTR|nr:hypothetical protein L1987_56389 [Smallanthus sonchifolius]
MLYQEFHQARVIAPTDFTLKLFTFIDFSVLANEGLMNVKIEEGDSDPEMVELLFFMVDLEADCRNVMMASEA